MNGPHRQRPLHNGSSGSTVEVLLGLTVVGSAVLTAFALLPRRRSRTTPPAEEAPPTDDKDRDDPVE